MAGRRPGLSLGAGGPGVRYRLSPEGPALPSWAAGGVGTPAPRTGSTGLPAAFSTGSVPYPHFLYPRYNPGIICLISQFIAALPRASHISPFSFWGKLMGVGGAEGRRCSASRTAASFPATRLWFSSTRCQLLGGGCHSEVFQEVDHRRTTHRFPSSPRYVEATGRAAGSEQL